MVNLIKIGPVTPEITRAKTAPFWTRWQKSAHPTKYPSKLGTDRHRIFSAVRPMYGNYKTDKFCGSSQDVAMVTK